jgi:hypothetical protein
VSQIKGSALMLLMLTSTSAIVIPAWPTCSVLVLIKKAYVMSVKLGEGYLNIEIIPDSNYMEFSGKLRWICGFGT